MRALALSTLVGVFASPALAQFAVGTIVKLDEPLPYNPLYLEKVCGPPPVGSVGKIIKSSWGTTDMPDVVWQNRSNCSVSEQRTLVPLHAISMVKGAPPPKNEDSELEACNGLCSYAKDYEGWGVGLQRIVYDETATKCSKIPAKENKDIEKYLACYGTPHQQDYKKYYRPMIELAAYRFHVEPAVLKCLLHREGQWNKKELSGNCAYGLAQFMPEAAHDMGLLIGDSDARKRDHSIKATAVQQEWDKYMDDLQQADPQALEGCSSRNFFFNDHRLVHDAAVRKYEKEMELFKAGKMSSEPKAPLPCTDCDVSSDPILTTTNKGQVIRKYRLRDCFNRPKVYEDHRDCAAASIAAAAVKLGQIESRILKDKKFDHLTCEEFGNRVIAEMLAYNRGEGAAAKATKHEEDSSKWAAQIATAGSVAANSEALDHMQSVQNCLRAGKVRDWQPPAHIHQRQCDVEGFPDEPGPKARR
jgi:hypothetical protein